MSKPRIICLQHKTVFLQYSIGSLQRTTILQSRLVIRLRRKTSQLQRKIICPRGGTKIFFDVQHRLRQN